MNLGPSRGSRISMVEGFMHDGRVSDAAFIPGGSWRSIDSETIMLSVRKCEQDYEEARWLLAAHLAGVHEQLGFASFSGYVEKRLGHKPKATADRLRVARALAETPELRELLRTCALPWTAIRELVRVMTPD